MAPQWTDRLLSLTIRSGSVYYLQDRRLLTIGKLPQHLTPDQHPYPPLRPSRLELGTPSGCSNSSIPADTADSPCDI